jgi:hypothetical protein
MLKQKLVTLIVTLAAAGAVFPAFAETDADASFSGMMAMSRIDKNKDGMVSKQEFMDTMGKIWDMKAKEMKAKDDKFDKVQMQQILMYLRAGS